MAMDTTSTTALMGTMNTRCIQDNGRVVEEELSLYSSFVAAFVASVPFAGNKENAKEGAHLITLVTMKKLSSKRS